MTHRLLIINPGSTSTKIALYDDAHPVQVESLRHSAEEIACYPRVADQYLFRQEAILGWLAQVGQPVSGLSAAIGRGGLMRPLSGGTYRVNQRMLTDLASGEYGEHASNLGARLALEIATAAGGKPAFIVDPVVVDEMEAVARVSGLPGIPRRSMFHALNQKAVARRCARDLGQPYNKLNLIVAHLGGGITVGAHCQGRVIDVNNGLDAEGPMSPERAGTLPILDLAHLCFSWQYTLPEIGKKLVGRGGLVAHLGINDGREIEARIDAGDIAAAQVYEAMAYQVAKEIGRCAAALAGRVDAVVLTGGMAHSTRLTGWIQERTEFIAPVRIYPGEDEMQALAEGGLRVLRGEEVAKEY